MVKRSAQPTPCAKCGACTSVCPVYRVTGRESLTARGRLHLLDHYEPGEKASAAMEEIFSKCLLCGACRSSCSRNIDTPGLIVKARETIPPMGGPENFKASTIKKALEHQGLLKALGLAVRASAPILKNLLPKESGLRLKLSIFDQPVVDDTRPQKAPETQKLALFDQKIAFFPGCLARYVEPEIDRATRTLLGKLCSTSAIAPQETTCCGMAAWASGDHAQAVRLAKKNIAAFEDDSLANLPILTSCATCYTHMGGYPGLFDDADPWQDRARRFSRRLREFSSFFSSALAQLPAAPSRLTQALQVCYHDPCHLRHRLDPAGTGKSPIVKEPRELIGHFQGLDLLELPTGAKCCGQGGLFHLNHPELSEELRSDLLGDIEKTAADLVTTTCSGCLLQLRSGILARQDRRQAVHLAVLLAGQLEE